ncbi:hypothetical protein [Effusibacillus pohliae]|uniref:hypothetical protein n=1 Tax=Effusibacillus pohliae TaxID=232270 RepID=UPI000366E1F2|nr:hypothetical protein [Effusibacillus pohliae]
MGSGINPAWWLALNTILLLLILPGGFFMFRAFLRRMKQEEHLDQPGQKRE